MELKNIGIEVKKPKGKCSDNNCTFHGKLPCRGRIFTGTVISFKMQKTVTVEWDRKIFLKKSPKEPFFQKIAPTFSNHPW